VKTASVGDGDEHTIVEIKGVLRLWREDAEGAIAGQLTLDA
jgi:hypothetical protein